jgi:hypothetical protein
MTLHWLDGIRQLNWNFWRLWWRDPADATKLALLTIAVAVRDFFLWICMGKRYLDED